MFVQTSVFSNTPDTTYTTQMLERWSWVECFASAKNKCVYKHGQKTLFFFEVADSCCTMTFFWRLVHNSTIIHLT